MNQNQGNAVDLIRSGGAVLGIEFGSTRIKASLIAPDTTPLASGAYTWENQLKDGVWTYDMQDVWKGVAACYASLVDDVRAKFGLELKTVETEEGPVEINEYFARHPEMMLGRMGLRNW